MFIRNESFRQFIRFYPVVTWLIGIVTVLFLISFLLPPVYRVIYAWGVGSNYHLAAGEFWRLVTPIFLHGNFAHYLFNSFSMVVFAPPLEVILGRWRFLRFFLLAGILSNLGTLIFGPDMYFYLGASGAIYGLFGVYLYMVMRRKDLIDPGSRQIVVTILVIGAVYSFSPGVSLLGHLFGFLAGLLLGPLVLKRDFGYFQPMHVRRHALPDENEIGFDPQRWRKARRNRQAGKYVLIGVLVLLVLFGLLA